jgi:hypothetical protein
MISRLTRSCLLAIAGTAILATTAYAQPARRSAPPTSSAHAGATGDLPSPAAARSIVSNLWAQREGALTILDADLLGPYESGSALRQDGAYVDFVLCGCNPKKDAHPADRVVARLPAGSGSQVFFAEVHTTNTTSHRHPWYVVAVAHTGGQWKLVFVTLGSYTAAPPLGRLTGSATSTLAETSDARARMLHLAAATAARAAVQDAPVRHTSYGAAIHTRDAVEPAKDGVYGLALPAHKVLSCFTLHTFETFSMPGGLQQDATQHNWTDLLEPGAYASVTLDNAMPECAVGPGTGSKPGTIRMQYDSQIVGATGVPL